MALIKCNGCGHMVSDKGTKCPKCGTPIKKNEPTNPTEKNIITEKNQDQSSQWGGSSSTERTFNKPKNKANNLLIAFLAIAIVSFIMIVLYFLQQDNRGSEYDNAMTACDTVQEVQLIDSIPTGNHVEEETETVRVDTVAIETTESMEETEDGFLTNNDVMVFVCGNRYTHDDITLVVTEDGIYANDNKLGDNPKFKRLSKNKGTIKTSEISITVIRDNNTLVDNKSGDIYHNNYY